MMTSIETLLNRNVRKENWSKTRDKRHEKNVFLLSFIPPSLEEEKLLLMLKSQECKCLSSNCYYF